MKTTAFVCAVLAGTLGFSGLATARDGRGDRDERGTRFEQRQDRREARQERREIRQDRREDRAFRQGYRAGVQQPRYTYQQPAYRYSAPRFHRGGYLPQQYRHNHYRVSNWNAYPGLYAPPYGHQWVNVDGEFLLVALATGLIANALLN